MSTTEIILIINLFITLLVAVLVLVQVKSRGEAADWKSDFTIFGAELGKVGPLLREELTRSREEEQRTARDTRAELASSVKSLSDSLSQQFQNLLNQLGTQGTGLADRLAALATTNEDKFEKLILANDANLKDFREQLLNLLKTHREEAAQSATERQVAITTSLKAFEDRFAQNVKDFNSTLEKTRESMVSTLDRMREVTAATLEKNREVMVNTLETTRQTVENRLDKTRETVESRLGVLQEENNKKLEEMRATVDEKLQTSVEKRFNESFKLISERLDQVHKGLGEMQTLASGVGDLKKVLTNVKTRGNLGEVQLGAILEEIFSVDQYEQNVSVKAGSQERVEFANIR